MFGECLLRRLLSSAHLHSPEFAGRSSQKPYFLLKKKSHGKSCPLLSSGKRAPELHYAPPVTGKVEYHAISGQPSRQNDLTRGENDTGWRRDVDNKDVSTTGVTLSRSRSNES